jgi:hypothetical protein
MPGSRARVAALACVLAGLVWTPASAGTSAQASAPTAAPASDRASGDASPLAVCTPADGNWTYDRLLCLYRTGTQQNRLDDARARQRSLSARRVAKTRPAQL